MGSHAAPNWSPVRLAIALAIQAAFAVLDIAISGSLTITGTVLLVPLVLAVIGQQREVAICGVVAIAVAIGATFWNPATGTGQTIYRISFYTVFAMVAVVAARARERATALAGANQELATELRGTQARLDGILGSLGEAVTVHDEQRQDGLRQRRGGEPARLRERRRGAGGRAGRAGAAVPHHARGRLARPARRPAGTAPRGRRGRAVAAHPQHPARHRRGALAAHQGDALHRPQRRAARHQHHRGRHRGQGRRAAPAVPGRGRAAAGDVARLRADARARGAHDRPRPGRLVRHRDGRRAGRVAPGGGRPRRSRQGPARARPAAPLSDRPRRPDRRPGDPARRPGRAVHGHPAGADRARPRGTRSTCS